MNTVDQNITPITSRLGSRPGRQDASEAEKTAEASATADHEERQDHPGAPLGQHHYDQAEADALVKAGQEIERFLRIKDPNTRLRIDRDVASSRLVYQVVDRLSGDVVKQFQPSDLLRYLKSFREIEGLVVDGKS